MEVCNSEIFLGQLEKILASPEFVRSGRLGSFLRFVVQQELSGRGDQLKESIVGVEVFGRRPDYDVRQDSIVRVEAGKLRARLAKYYATSGVADPLIIELPKGGYRPVLRTGNTKSAVAVRRRSRLALALAGAALLLGAAGWWRFETRNPAVPIAVLPLINLNQDPADDYFADGLTGEIIRNLSLIDGLVVRSQTSSFVFKGKPMNVRDAGNQLAVDYVVEGSVLRSGQQLRVDAQLVRARDDFTLWSGKYDRELTDVFVIQEEISRGIVNSLRLKLGRGRRRYETSVEAYDLYLRARALAKGQDEQIATFEQATRKDSSFAPAYSGLAAALAFRSGFDRFDPMERVRQIDEMRAAAEKAIQLDPLLAEAHGALAIMYARDAQWNMSEKSFRRALEVEPGNASTRSDFAWFLLLPIGRVEDALAELRIAERMDPLSPDVRSRMMEVL